VIHLLYGQPGTGKSTLATGICHEYASAGKKVATNYHVDFAPLSHRPDGVMASAFCTVIPDRPSIDDLMALGSGWHDGEFGREDRSGLLVVDESGPWLNSRTWSAAGRGEIIDWFLHSRKRGWDIVLIAQSPSLIDKQVRDAVIEGYARCRRMDRVKVPVLGVSMPRIHVAVARYGLDQNAPVLQRWWYRGGTIHKCFQSYQVFAQGDAVSAPYCTLPPRLTKWAGHRTLSQRFAAWWAGSGAPRPVPRAKVHPVLRLLARLPPDEAVRHWQRFNSLGAFDVAA